MPYFLGKMIIIKLKTQCSSIHQPTTHTFYTHREANRESLTKQMFVFSDCGSSWRKPVPTQGGPVISRERLVLEITQEPSCHDFHLIFITLTPRVIKPSPPTLIFLDPNSII